MPTQLISASVSVNAEKGLKADQIAIEKVRNALENREAAMQEIKKHMTDRWKVNFTSEGEIYGKWKGLSTTWTIPDRMDKGYGSGPILVRTGRLFQSFVTANDAGEVTNQAITWNFMNTGNRGGETGEGWFVAQHLGYPNPRTGHQPIPPRVLWDINEDDENAIQEIMDNYVNSIIQKYMPITI